MVNAAIKETNVTLQHETQVTGLFFVYPFPRGRHSQIDHLVW